MSELYNRIDAICKARGTNITALCKKAGVGRATLSELNAGRTRTLKLETAQKLADSLGVSLNFLQGKFDDGLPIEFTASTEEIKKYLEKKKAPTQEGERQVSDDEIKIALWGTKEINDDVLDRVKQFAKFAQEEEKSKNS